ncbi:MAG: nucleotide exchange factor GrpE [Planctomycetales bacterium]|nr:nucleotide exchange factor GrpE [Planctomycetales bacterium]
MSNTSPEQHEADAAAATEAAATETTERPATGDQDLAAELAEAQQRALRAQAELENFRKRVRREIEDLEKYAAVGLLRDLLGVVDDLDRAIAAAETSPDGAGLLEGVKLVRTRMADALGQHGVAPIEAHGAPFDPAVHEAILHQPTTEHPAGSVMHVALPGYTLHQRVVRPAQVVVAKQSEQESQ